MNSEAEIATAATAATNAEETPCVFGKVECAPFSFPAEEDAAVYAEVEDVLAQLQSAPSPKAFVAVQGKLMSLAGYPLVTAVVSGRYPFLFSLLTKQQKEVVVANAAPARVAGVDWDLWCRNTWLTNACAVDDLGDVAKATLPTLSLLLRRVEKNNDNHVNEVWSVLHILAWALRSSPAAPSLVEPLTHCTALWTLVETELVREGRHTSLQLVLLDLLSALALHAAASPELLERLCTVAGGRAQFPHPTHFHTALKLYYACVTCDRALAQAQTTHQHLQKAWANLQQQQADAVPIPLRAAEWVVDAEAEKHLAVASRLHQLLVAKTAAPSVEDVHKFHTAAAELPTVARAFCAYALPGNVLMWLESALAEAPSVELVTEVVATLVDVALGGQPPAESADQLEEENKRNVYVQYCIQQLWINGLGAALQTLMKRCDPTITAAVVRLLHLLAARSLRGSSARRVLLGTPSVSLVADVLSGVAEAADVKAELEKPAVAEVVQEALALVCTFDDAELTSVFTDALVFTVSTLVSEGKETPSLLRRGLRALARLAAAFPMAGASVIDTDFLMEQCGSANPPAGAAAALVVGSLEVMSAIVTEQPAAVTFEWIEMLLNLIQNLGGWRDAVTGLDAALWRCVRGTLEAAEDSADFLFTEECQEVLRNEVERVKYGDDNVREIVPSLFGILVAMQSVVHDEVNTAMMEAIARVAKAQWTTEMCDGALRFIAAACPSDEEGSMMAAAVNAGPSKEEKEAFAPENVAKAAVVVLDGAFQSHVQVASETREQFVCVLEENGVAADVQQALFAMADTSLDALDKGELSEEGCTQLSRTVLPLLHCVVSNCASARTEATAASAARLLASVAALLQKKAACACAMELVDAALLLVNDTCAVGTLADEDVAKQTEVMKELWPSLAVVTRRAADMGGNAAWQRILSRVFTAAHALILGSPVYPFTHNGDPRLDYIGVCGLPHVALEPCNALVQTVLNYDDARTYLQSKYPEVYVSSLEYMVDPAHAINGLVPLAVQRYLEETKKAAQ